MLHPHERTRLRATLLKARLDHRSSMPCLLDELERAVEAILAQREEVQASIFAEEWRRARARLTPSPRPARALSGAIGSGGRPISTANSGPNAFNMKINLTGGN